MLLATASSSTTGPVFWILGSGDLVAIAVALVANLVTIYVTRKDRAAHDTSEKRTEEWRRKQAKHDRIYGHFAGVIFAANVLEAMTGPLSWKPDQYKSAAEMESYRTTLDGMMKTFADAASSLTVEGMTGEVEDINQIARKFAEFRHGLYLLGEHEQTKEDVDKMFAAADEIKKLREKLEKELPAIRQGILPDKPQ